ncbi:MAG TPA: hypothetical protein VN253_05545 [Kofleriaceae bacterium]|nr:hypothetical protein [Kofleriaceae bacterium]
MVDQAGDRLTMTVTYRLELRPKELRLVGGELDDLWVVAEKRALLVLGTGETVGAQVTGSGIVHIPYDAPLDPVTATRLPSPNPHHIGTAYIAATEEQVNVFGPSAGGTSLVQDAAGVDLLAYGDPLRTMMALKRILKDKRVAGQGGEVARTHASVQSLLGKVKDVSAGLREHLRLVRSYRDGKPGEIWFAEEVLKELANAIADLRHQGRGQSEDAHKLVAAHRQLLELHAEAAAARPPPKGFAGHMADVVLTPFRWAGRTAQGVGELGKMGVDATMLGVDALGHWTGAYQLDWKPISDYGKWVESTDASALDGVVQIANGFVEQWRDAIERAGHGDYSGLIDTTIDTALMVEGARTTGITLKAKAPLVIAKAKQLVELAKRAAPRLPAEARNIVRAMAEATDAFLAKQGAAGMQMAAGPKKPPGLTGSTPQSIAEGLEAARATFAEARLAQHKSQTIEALKRRLGKEPAPDVAEWVTRVEAAFGGDPQTASRFFKGIVARVHDPAPFMREVEALLGSPKLSPDDFRALFGEVLSQKLDDPIKLLADVRVLLDRSLSGQTRSTLIRRAAKGQVDLDWIRRTRLTDKDLDFMGADDSTSWKEFETVSDIPSARKPGPLTGRPPDPEQARGANSKVRGIAGEMVAAEVELPHGLRMKQRQFANNSSRNGDFELVTRDGSPAELEVKSYRAEYWEKLLKKYVSGKSEQIQRLIEQVQAARARGRKSYVAVTDAISQHSRTWLTGILKPCGLEELIFLPESELLRVARQLRERMGIGQAKPSAPKSPAPEEEL